MKTLDQCVPRSFAWDDPEEWRVGERLADLPPFYAGAVLRTIVIGDDLALPFRLSHNAVFDRATADEAIKIRANLCRLVPNSSGVSSEHPVLWEFERASNQKGEGTSPDLSESESQRSTWNYFTVRCDSPDTCRDLGLIDQLSAEQLNFNSLALYNSGAWFSIPDLARRFQYGRGLVLPLMVDASHLCHLVEVYETFVSVKEEFPEIPRALKMYQSLTQLPPGSDFEVLGLFAIIEMLITHNPKLEDRGDSITHQMKSKIPLVSRRFHPTLPYAIYFDRGVSTDALWGAMYSFRSVIAHGGTADFSTGVLRSLRILQTH